MGHRRTTSILSEPRQTRVRRGPDLGPDLRAMRRLAKATSVLLGLGVGAAAGLCLLVSGLLRLGEFFVTRGTGGVT